MTEGWEPSSLKWNFVPSPEGEGTAKNRKREAVRLQPNPLGGWGLGGDAVALPELFQVVAVGALGDEGAEGRVLGHICQQVFLAQTSLHSIVVGDEVASLFRCVLGVCEEVVTGL